jgi:hypothetical protein
MDFPHKLAFPAMQELIARITGPLKRRLILV